MSELPRGIQALNQGASALRRSVSGEARSALCGMGSCHECRDRQGVRTCLPMQPAANSQARRIETAIAIFGAGPAGIASARAALASHQRVLLIDDNLQAGGQIWRGEGRAIPAGVEWLGGASVLDAPSPHHVRLVSDNEHIDVHFERAVLCTGATERFLPFPGWTLPGVFGAGGLQALVKSGLAVAGKRVVLAGSGPLLLAVAALLQRRGAHVLCLLEQAPRSRVRSLIGAVWNRPGKLLQAGQLFATLRGIPRHHEAWVLRAEGRERLESITVRLSTGSGTRETRIECDALAIGYGLVPRVRVAQALGCELADDRVRVDERQTTSIGHIFAAGECTGIGGLGKALAEGELAGRAAAGLAIEARHLRHVRQEQVFADALARVYALDPRLRELADPDTIVCRCEDVRLRDLDGLVDWREARLQARVGMGPCQGTVCAPALEFLRGYAARDPRAPLSPVPLERLSHPPQ